MNEYLLLKLAHVVAFAYWLGGDLGTFLASRQVVNRDNSPEARSVALKIMLACDMGPKLSMPLILPLGIHLAVYGGWLPLTGLMLAVIWLLCLYWFAVVLVLYINEGKPFTARLSKADFWFRIVFASCSTASRTLRCFESKYFRSSSGTSAAPNKRSNNATGLVSPAIGLPASDHESDNPGP